MTTLAKKNMSTASLSYCYRAGRSKTTFCWQVRAPRVYEPRVSACGRSLGTMYIVCVIINTFVRPFKSILLPFPPEVDAWARSARILPAVRGCAWASRAKTAFLLPSLNPFHPTAEEVQGLKPRVNKRKYEEYTSYDLSNSYGAAP